MRFYLLFDPTPSTAIALAKAGSDIGGFKCSTIVKTMDYEVHKVIKFPPELVIINLDSYGEQVNSIIEKLNKALGIPPNYIGITASASKGFKAYKKGFIDVIEHPLNSIEVNKVLAKYKATREVIKFYCISYYYDFQYIYLNHIIVIKADGYTTEFILKDGTRITNFKTLKYSHEQLPFNFQRIHKSFVINSYYVRRIHLGKKKIYLRNFQVAIPLSKSFLGNISNVKKALLEASSEVYL